MATTKGSNVVKLASSKDTAPAKKAKTGAEKKPAAKKEKKLFEDSVLMQIRKDTKGAIAYEAVDSKGNRAPLDSVVIDSVYSRKAKMPAGIQFVEVTIREIPGLSAKPKRVETENDEED